MQIRKTYKDINPLILYNEVRDFVLRQGLTLDQNKLETYSMPTDSSTFIYRGTMTFQSQGKEALSAYIIGVDKGETRIMIDSYDELFPAEKVAALEDDLSFMLGTYENK
ncbi:MAG: hypothetical protein PHU23_03445 [Dehalococcoidales bacterium]|nr:hypothetical protein [Dehalococcoidales bacterium]